MISDDLTAIHLMFIISMAMAFTQMDRQLLVNRRSGSECPFPGSKRAVLNKTDAKSILYHPPAWRKMDFPLVMVGISSLKCIMAGFS